MKHLRKFSIFLLFIALFAAIVFGVLSGYLEELFINLRTGTGSARYFLVTEGRDNNAYALSYDDGLKLVAIGEKGRLYERMLYQGLPERFEVDDLHVTRGGAVMLSLYAYTSEGALNYELYVSQGGSAFHPLISKPCTGVTHAARRDSVRLSSMSEYAGKVCFFLQSGKQCDQYTYDDEGEAGLVLDGAFLLEGGMRAGIVLMDKTIYIAPDAGGLVAINGNTPQELPAEGMLFTRFMQTAGGFCTVDGSDGAIRGYDAAKKTWETLFEQSALSFGQKRIFYIAARADEGLLVLCGFDELYDVHAAKEVKTLTPYLYRVVWQSGLIAAGLVLGVLALAYSCFYFLSEAKKLYFPIVLRSLLTLGVLAALCVYAALHYVLWPMNEQRARSDTLATLAAYTGLLAQGGGELSAGAQGLAVADVDFADVTLLELSDVSKAWRVMRTTDGRYGVGFLASAPGALGPLIDELAKTSAFPHTGMLAGADAMRYCAYVRTSTNTVLVTVVDGYMLEDKLAKENKETALYLGGIALLLVLIAGLSYGGVARGIWRITKGVDVLSSGMLDVAIVQNSGDELQALAASFNGLAAALNKRFKSAQRRNESYLQFIPEQLVTLLGATSIEEVDKSVSVSCDMAMMVVGFRFPDVVYRSDPETLFQNINEVIERTSGIVTRNDGTIYNFTYDGFDAVFKSGAKAATSAAVEIRQEILALNQERKAQGGEPVVLRVAIDKGNMKLGVVGDDQRMVPTAVSAGLNTARMLINISNKLNTNILCTMAVTDAAKEYAVRYIGKARGGEGALRVYELFDGDAYDVRLAKENTREQFSEGVYTIYSHNFKEAKRMFMNIVRNYGGDGVARHYLYLADKYEGGAPEDMEIYLN